MPSPCHLLAFRIRCSAVTFALAWLAVLGLVAQNIVTSHSHAHRHEMERVAVAADDHAAGHAHDEAPVAEHDHHHHSGDPDTDLQNLGHTHTGGAAPGLPPVWSFHAAAPYIPLLALPANERPPGDSHPDTPFRPPIV